MKTFFSTAIALLMAISANAQDYNLYVQTADGETGYELAALQKLTFENGKIVLTKKDGTVAQSTTLSVIKRIYFSTTPVGIDEVNASTSQQVSKDAIYDLTGRKVTEIDIKNLPKGIYIQDGKKILVK